MKSIIFFLFSIYSFGQSTVKFIDINTNEPLENIYCTKYRDDYFFESNGITGKQGLYNVYIQKFDSLATYKIYIHESKSLRFLKKISYQKDTLTIAISKQDPENVNPKFIDMQCPHYSFGNFRIKEFDKLDSIDTKIIEKSWGYLKKKVTKKNLKKIYFSYGREMNLDIQKEYNPSSTNTAKYFLCFGFSDKEKGIKNYGIYLELDSSGNLMNEINFPDCNKNPDCFGLIAFEALKNNKHAKKFYIEKTTKIELEVNEELNILCWKFINEKYEPNGIYITDELFFNAHNGKFLKKEKTKGEWVE